MDLTCWLIAGGLSVFCLIGLPLAGCLYYRNKTTWLDYLLSVRDE